ncbi:hypothetical protein Bsp3421_005226 [Burkholderia sp. FERM BP-3421]|jgi:hypothetical protein|uniref:hypothetical protein n=1 Tax=Burkholderia sp. FERM BP-3421 TaxID=1494466 RepID=UPI00235FD73F|nr:hypothetical protein [Burkholderia sp. FERM BP-3421]WDD90380.1 hypothetical protein Bsp3421_000215 [Burkholderia sp. FERM BP-3421]WDD95068.1 hypothetical protein Bsp3421_005226 [Burkholderia sp. FERM BP-3421]
MSTFMPVISARQFIELVNQRLSSHHVFKSGMRVFLVRPASTNDDVTEFDFLPRTRRASGVVVYIVDQVKSQFLVEPDLRLTGT